MNWETSSSLDIILFVVLVFAALVAVFVDVGENDQQEKLVGVESLVVVVAAAAASAATVVKRR